MKRLITWFVDNPVISNLLMILIIAGGAFTISTLKMEVFPSFELDIITVSVVYPGAYSEDVEKSVCIPIEESVYGISGIKRVISSSSDGYGLVLVEILPGQDPKAIKDEIESGVDSISIFPSDIEKPITTQIKRDSQVLNVTIFGDMDPKSINVLANEVKDDLDNIDGINLTRMAVPKTKTIFIDLSRESLIKHDMSISDFEKAIKSHSIEIPAGRIKGQYFERPIKVEQKAYSAEEVSNIRIVSPKTSKYTRIGDIAHVFEGFEQEDIKLQFNSKPSSSIKIFRTGKQNALEVAEKVRDYVRVKKKELPSGIEIEIWNDESKFLKGRLDLLLKNAWIGLSLVLLLLSFFLKPKFAFWVSLGIPISFLGAIWFFPSLDVSINMLSLFTFILVLGIVVDDAIVVGENFYRYKQEGKDSRTAAIEGAYEVSKPVIFAILTTMATFSPMLFVDGASGKIWKIFPLVVIPILFFSLFESLTILPFHLAHSKDRKARFKIIARISAFWDKMRIKVDFYLNIVIKNYYTPFLKKCLKNNLLTISTFLSVLILTIGLISSGYVKFNFFPGLEADIIYATLEFPKGTPIEKTEKAVEILQNSLNKLEMEYDKENNPENGIIRNVIQVVGAQPNKAETSGRGGAMMNSYFGDNLAEMSVELSPGESRSIKSSEIANRWRDLTPSIPGIKELQFSSSLFSAGEDVNFQFSGQDISALSQIVQEFKDNLSKYPGVYDIIDNNNKGSSELVLKMLPSAQYYGLDMYSVSSQIRDSFNGKKIMSLQRGRDEIDVKVGYSIENKSSLEDLRELMIRTSSGALIPVKSICSISLDEAYSGINRVNRSRSLSVIANVDESIANANEIIESIEKRDLPNILSKYPGISYSLEGQQKEQSENLNSLTRNYLFALFIVFLLLAVPFKSYFQPLIVMFAIPYGIIGAVVGHLLLGMDFSILSMLGIAALSGVVVNDSLVMMDYINRNKDKTNDPIQAALDAGPARFRPILLTSLTTFIGVMPLIFERSIQAKFLVPMAVSLGFGVLFSTLVTLILVPSSYIASEKIKEYLLKKIKNQLYINGSHK